MGVSWKDVHVEVDGDSARHGFSQNDALLVWKMGVESWEVLRGFIGDRACAEILLPPGIDLREGPWKG